MPSTTFFKRLGRRTSPNCTVWNSLSIQLNTRVLLRRTKLAAEVRDQGVHPEVFDRQRRRPASQVRPFLAPALSLPQVNPIGCPVTMSSEATLDKALHQDRLPPVALLKILRYSPQTLS